MERMERMEPDAQELAYSGEDQQTLPQAPPNDSGVVPTFPEGGCFATARADGVDGADGAEADGTRTKVGRMECGAILLAGHDFPNRVSAQLDTNPHCAQGVGARRWGCAQWTCEIRLFSETLRPQ